MKHADCGLATPIRNYTHHHSCRRGFISFLYHIGRFAELPAGARSQCVCVCVGVGGCFNRWRCPFVRLSSHNRRNQCTAAISTLIIKYITFPFLYSLLADRCNWPLTIWRPLLPYGYIYTVFRKKHPLTFSFISPLVMCRFKQKLQWIYLRNGRCWEFKNYIFIAADDVIMTSYL